MTTRRVIAAACALVLVGVVGCGGQNGSEDAPPETAATTQVPADFESKARAATNKLGVSLKSELTQAMQDGGPVAAVDVCHIRAGEIARTVREETGLEVGRVSTRTRNPQNAPSELEAAVLGVFQGRPSLQDTVVVDDGEAVYMRAIRIDVPTCLKCHGPSESLDPALEERLAQLYPQDEATGFTMGDLRGAFVVR